LEEDVAKTKKRRKKGTPKRTSRRRKKTFLKKKYITYAVSLIVFLFSYFGDKYNLGQKGMPSDETYRVLKVSDGDTVTINDHGEKRKLRLYGIDAPEKDQEYGMESREYLYNRIQDKAVNVDFISKDRYGRDISVIYLDGENINEAMVKEGYAWWYKDYAKDDLQYREYELKAKESKKGLWGRKNPVPPWEFRKRNKQKKGA
jgi:micrococcal nuclease